MTDRLELEAFEIPGNAAAARRANELWKQNLMPLVSNEVHREAFKKGDSYVIVQPDTEGIPRVWFNEADCIVVRYSDNVPGRLEVAAKRWLANDRRYRLNVYYADHIERYVTDRKKSDYETEEPDWTAYVPYSPDDIATSEIIPWDYGQVPVFHFANASLYTYGKSELGDVIPLQKAINKTVGDLMITSEFASFRQRYAVGVDPEEATAAWMKGVERILTFTSPDAKLGEFSASDLGQFLEVINAFRRHVAVVSAVPLHYLYETAGDFPSGDALKTAEARFDKKLRDRQTASGNVWGNVARYALRIDGTEVSPTQEIVTRWANTAPKSEKDDWEVATLQKAVGVPLEQILRERGYSDAQARKIAREAAAAAPAAPADAAAVATGNGRVSVANTDVPA
jgi:hypothetical protein